MKYADLIEHFGTQADAARALEVDRRLVDIWKKRRIPTNHQLKAAFVSGGKLAADAQAQAEGKEIASYVAPKKRAAA